MGTGGEHKCGGGNIKKPVKFPSNWTETLNQLGYSEPRIRYTKPHKGDYIRRGRIKKYGLTPEQQLMQYAPEGSKPERMVFGWLVRHDISFLYQESVLGGRAIPGGAVLDFVILHQATPIVVRIMSYWHENAEQEWRDDISLGALRDMGLVVEDVWEYEINTYDKVNRKMQEILYGRARFGAGVSLAQDFKRACPYCNDPCCTWCGNI